MEQEFFKNKTPLNNNLPNYTLLSQPEDKFYNSGEDGKNKKSFGKKVAITIAVIGAAALLASKGISGSTAGKIKQWTIKKQNEFLRFAAKNKTAGGLEKNIFLSGKYSKKIFALSDSIGNFTAAKDTLFHKFTSWDFVNMKFPKIQAFLKKWVPVSSWNFLNSEHPKIHEFLNKFLPLQKICNWFTNNILKITYHAVDTQYAKASNAYGNLQSEMLKLLQEAKKKGKSPKQIKLIEEKIKSLTTIFDEGFGKAARDSRLQNIHSGLRNLSDDVSGELLSTFKSKKKGGKGLRNLGTYVTERLSAPTKRAHQRVLDSSKIRLSNNVGDVYTRMTTAAGDLTYSFSAGDKKSRQMFGELLELFEEYKKHPASAQLKGRTEIKKKILDTLTKLRAKVGEASAKGIYTPQETKEIFGFISNVQKAANTSQKGLTQEILSDMKKLLGENSREYLTIKSHTNQANELLNNAIKIEGDNMVSKIAESKVGSIPTDVLALATPAIGGAMVISKGKDKNEKVGATLKVGIPILGFVGSYFYTASKAFSGSKNLMFGAITTFVLNRIGTAAYNYYQKRFVENKTVSDIAKDTYNNLTAV